MILRGTGQLEGMAYFELHPGEIPEPLHDAVSRAAASVLEFVRQTRGQQQPLWVLGM